MKLNMSKFHKIESNDTHTTFQHDDGHQMKVAHKNLSPSYKSQLDRMPIHKFKGGSTDTDTSTGGSNPGGASTGGVGSGLGGAGTGGAATGGASTGGAGTVNVTASGNKGGSRPSGDVKISNVGGKTQAGNVASGAGPGSAGSGGKGKDSSTAAGGTSGMAEGGIVDPAAAKPLPVDPTAEPIDAAATPESSADTATDTDTGTGGSNPGGASTGGVGSGLGGAGTGGASTGGASTGGAGTVNVTISGNTFPGGESADGKQLPIIINISHVGGKTDAGNVASGDGPGAPGIGGDGKDTSSSQGGSSDLPQKLAHGGMVQPRKTLGQTIGYPGFNQENNANESSQRANQLSSEVSKRQQLNAQEDKARRTYQAPQNYANGGMVANSSNQSAMLKANYKKQHFANGGQVADEEQNPQQTPVVINVGQPQMNPAMLNPNPGSQSNSNQPHQINAQEQAAINPGDQPYQMGGQQVPMQQPMAEQVAPASMAPQSPVSQTQGANLEQLPGGPESEQGLLHGLQQTEQGIMASAAAQSAQGKQEAQALQTAQPQLQTAQQVFQTNLADIQTKRADLQHDIQNMHIDPQRYINNMSTGSRLMTGIGMILGGIGSGATGGRNVVVDQFQHMIDQDINAQKDELGKKENLLSFNLKQEGNLRDAMSATRLQINDMLTNQLAIAAAKAKSPMAAANAQQALGELELKNGLHIQEWAARKSLMQTQGQPGHPLQKDPAEYIRLLVPGDKQGEVAKEIERAQNTTRQAAKIMDLFDQATSDMKGAGRATSLVKEPRSLQALKLLINTTVTDITGTARQAEFDSVANNALPQRMDSQADSEMRRKAMETYLSSKKSAPMAKTYGIDVDKFASTAIGQGSQKPEIKTVNGVKYMRGPNGQAIKVQ